MGSEACRHAILSSTPRAAQDQCTFVVGPLHKGGPHASWLVASWALRRSSAYTALLCILRVNVLGSIAYTGGWTPRSSGEGVMASPHAAISAVGIRPLPPFEQPLVSVGSSEYNSAASSPRGLEPGTGGDQPYSNGELGCELALGDLRHTIAVAMPMLQVRALRIRS